MLSFLRSYGLSKSAATGRRIDFGRPIIRLHEEVRSLDAELSGCRVYTPGLIGCTLVSFLGVHPQGSWVYTRGPLRCTPKAASGVHLAAAYVYT